MIERESTDLPEPDSPTMPSVLPRSSVSETPSTACTSPRGVLKKVWTPSTSSSGPSSGASANRSAVDLLAPQAHRALSRTSKRARTMSPR